MERLSRVEISREAIAENMNTFRQLIGQKRLLLSVVKSNAYGHGMIPFAQTALETGADWLGVFAFEEARALRRSGIRAPILVYGPVSADDLAHAAKEDIRVTVASPERLRQLAVSCPENLRIHLKIETGTNRQGLQSADFEALSALPKDGGPTVEGVYTHFADIEDTTDHSYAEKQTKRFRDALDKLRGLGIVPSIRHAACSAAAILFPDTYFDLVRVGIAGYGLWPSKETYISARELGRDIHGLKPVMTWRTQIIQIKTLAAGEYVGYGRSYRTTRETRVATLPVGYANGYDRKLSNNAHVLIRGRRAPVLGRVTMNMIMTDVTDIEEAKTGDDAVLLGQSGNESIFAETLAVWIGTINYEVVTRIEPGLPRVLIA